MFEQPITVDDGATPTFEVHDGTNDVWLTADTQSQSGLNEVILALPSGDVFYDAYRWTSQPAGITSTPPLAPTASGSTQPIYVNDAAGIGNGSYRIHFDQPIQIANFDLSEWLLIGGGGPPTEPVNLQILDVDWIQIDDAALLIDRVELTISAMTTTFDTPIPVLPIDAFFH